MDQDDPNEPPVPTPEPSDFDTPLEELLDDPAARQQDMWDQRAASLRRRADPELDPDDR
jgi:hypothetical protein